MSSYQECKAITELDLEPIKVKLMHKESGEGWTLEYANAVEAEYRRFLYLMKMFPHEAAAPLMDVDTFWHYHILDTMKYALDCETVFGYFLHHFPYVGLRGEDDLAAHEQMGDRMRVLYEATFGEKYRAQPFGHEAEATAYSSAPGIAYSSAPGKPGNSTLGTAYSSAPGIAYSSAPAKPGHHAMLAPAYSSAPGIAYSSAPAKPSSQVTLATAYSSAPGIAYSSAPAQPKTHARQVTAYSSAPGIAYSSAPGQPAGSAASPAGKSGAAVADFFSTRPRLESTAFA